MPHGLPAANAACGFAKSIVRYTKLKRPQTHESASLCLDNELKKSFLDPQLFMIADRVGPAMPQAYRYIALAPIVVIDDWPVAEEPLTGSRAKNTVYDPVTHRNFVFKKPKPDRESQMWSELIASYVAGDLLAWPVQHVAIASYGESFGNLIGYIYNSDGDEFIEGWSFCREQDPDYDLERGEHHTLPLLMAVGRALEADGLAEESFAAFWARAFALDALLSNTDRHAENWAVIKTGDQRRMAPLYDNATSLGCEVDEGRLAQSWFDGRNQLRSETVQRYLSRGRHHVRLEQPGSRGTPFADICSAFLQVAPEQRAVFEQVANLDLQPVSGLLAEIIAMEGVPAPYAMSERRAVQIESLLISGRERIRNILEQEPRAID